MELIIYFENKQNVEVRLAQGGQVIAVSTIPLDPHTKRAEAASQPAENTARSGVRVDNHFDTKLVTSIDKILKENRIETSSLKTVKVQGSVDSSSVAYNIALAVAAALKSK